PAAWTAAPAYAGSRPGPTAAVRSPSIPTAPAKDGAPLPSTIRAFLIRRSKRMGSSVSPRRCPVDRPRWGKPGRACAQLVDKRLAFRHFGARWDGRWRRWRGARSDLPTERIATHDGGLRGSRGSARARSALGRADAVPRHDDPG